MARRIRGLGRLVVVSISPVRDADAARAVEYASLLGGIERTAVSDRDIVPAWASRLGADRRCGLRSGPVHRLPGRPSRGH